MTPRLFEHDDRSYMVSGEAINWGGTLWRFHLLRDVSDAVAFQRQLNGLLLLAAVLASVVLLINRGGIRRGLARSSASATPGVRGFSFSAAAALRRAATGRASALAMAFNLLDRLAESFDPAEAIRQHGEP